MQFGDGDPDISHINFSVWMRVLEIDGETVQCQGCYQEFQDRLLPKRLADPCWTSKCAQGRVDGTDSGQILRLEQHRILQHVLLSYVTSTPHSTPHLLFGDVPSLDLRMVAEAAKDKEIWKSISISLRCPPLHWELQLKRKRVVRN